MLGTYPYYRYTKATRYRWLLTTITDKSKMSSAGSEICCWTISFNTSSRKAIISDTVYAMILMHASHIAFDNQIQLLSWPFWGWTVFIDNMWQKMEHWCLNVGASGRWAHQCWMIVDLSECQLWFQTFVALCPCLPTRKASRVSCKENSGVGVHTAEWSRLLSSLWQLLRHCWYQTLSKLFILLDPSSARRGGTTVLHKKQQVGSISWNKTSSDAWTDKSWIDPTVVRSEGYAAWARLFKQLY